MSFKHIVLLILINLPFAATAQSSQQQKIDSVFVLVKKYFNDKNTGALYALTGEAFKKELTPDAFKNVCSQQLYPLGQMQQTPLISFADLIATYKITFPLVTFKLLISLDKTNKVELFLFQPYADAPQNKSKPAITSNTLKTRMDIRVDSAARTYIQKGNTVGLSIGIFKNGQTLTYGYGETVKGNGKLPDQNTIFELGSISKTFTSILIANYINQEKIKLTDPVTKYLPDSLSANKNLQKITILSLCNHTSGLDRLPDNLDKHPGFDVLDPYNGYNNALLFAYLKNCKLNIEPGTTYAYSNLGAGLLGVILERVSGQAYGQLVNKLICKPARLSSTMQYLPADMSRVATVYNAQGDQTPLWHFDALAGCGSLHSTVTDLLLYAQANMIASNTPLSKAMQLSHQITFDKGTKLGLAWHILKVSDVEFIFHNGGTYGSSSFLAFNADKNIAVVVLSNVAESTDQLGAELLKLLL